MKTITAPARPGDLLFIWGTGLAAGKGPDNAATVAGELDLPVDVYVGNQKAEVSYHGRSGCCAGLDPILFKVPDGAQGCSVAVHDRPRPRTRLETQQFRRCQRFKVPILGTRQGSIDTGYGEFNRFGQGALLRGWFRRCR